MATTSVFIVCALAIITIVSASPAEDNAIGEQTLVRKTRIDTECLMNSPKATSECKIPAEHLASDGDATFPSDEIQSPGAGFQIFCFAISAWFLKKMFFTKAAVKPEILCAHLGMALASVLSQIFNEGQLEELSEELPQMLETQMREVLSPVVGERHGDEFATAVKAAFIKYYTPSSTKPSTPNPNTKRLADVSSNTQLVQSKKKQRTLEVTQRIDHEDAASTTEATSEVVQDIVVTKDSSEYSVEGKSQGCTPYGAPYSVELDAPSCGMVPPYTTFGSAVPPDVLNVMKRSVEAQERLVEAQERLVELKWLGLQQKGADMSRRMSLKEEGIKLSVRKTALMEETNEIKRSKFEYEIVESQNQAMVAGCVQLCRRCADDLMGGMLVMIATMGYGTWKQSPRWFNECHIELPEKPRFAWQYMAWTLSVVEELGKSCVCFFKGTLGVLVGLLAFFLLASFMFKRLLGTSIESKPGTVLIVVCGGLLGYAGKLTVNLLGGNGRNWFVFWELLCFFHAFSNYKTRTLYHLFKERRGYVRFLVEPGFHLMMMVVLPLTVGLAAFPEAWLTWV